MLARAINGCFDSAEEIQLYHSVTTCSAVGAVLNENMLHCAKVLLGRILYNETMEAQATLRDGEIHHWMLPQG
jgi:hypothetical protein